MRKLLISFAAAGSALALATPAAAQYYPQQQPYGYGGQQYGYGGQQYGYGYNDRAQMQNELRQIRFQADNLARQGRLTPYEARDLYGDIHSAERALYRANNPWEARALSQKIAHIRYELHRYADYDGRRGYGYNRGYNGYNGYNNDHDRDRDWDHDRD